MPIIYEINLCLCTIPAQTLRRCCIYVFVLKTFPVKQDSAHKCPFTHHRIQSCGAQHIRKAPLDLYTIFTKCNAKNASNLAQWSSLFAIRNYYTAEASTRRRRNTRSYAQLKLKSEIFLSDENKMSSIRRNVGVIRILLYISSIQFAIGQDVKV